MKYIINYLIFTLCLALTSFVQAEQKVIYVMSSGGFTAAYQRLAPTFEAETGYRLITSYGASTGGAADSIPSRLARGERADVVILSRKGLDKLTAMGFILPESRTDLGISAIAMSVRAGSDVPDISTVSSFKEALLNAESIAFSASVSGTYLSTEVFPSLGIWEQIKSKSTRVVSERVGAVLARGEVQIGFQQVTELLPFEGITYVGLIPSSLNKHTSFSAGIVKSGSHIPAGILISYLSSPRSHSAIKATGMQIPPTPR